MKSSFVFIFAAAACAVAFLFCACSAHKSIPTVEAEVPEAPQLAELEPIGSKPVGVVLKATAFKMSGDFAGHVAVTLGSNGRLAYFPAPTDISEYSQPVEIGDGWWFNRQGLGPQSVFTKWTFAEYMALPQTPSADEIKAAIIPDACVTDFRQLPITASEANQLPPASLLKYLQ